MNLALAGTAWPLKWRRERNVGEVVLHLKATPVVKVDGKIGGKKIRYPLSFCVSKLIINII